MARHRRGAGVNQTDVELVLAVVADLAPHPNEPDPDQVDGEMFFSNETSRVGEAGPSPAGTTAALLALARRLVAIAARLPTVSSDGLELPARTSPARRHYQAEPEA